MSTIYIIIIEEKVHWFLKTNFIVIIAKVELWLDNVIKMQCLEKFEVMIIIN